MADILSQEIHEGDVIVHGGARGADLLSGVWAEENHFQVIEVPALWSHGKGAGFARNEVIASLPLRLLIAFPGGNGTADMVRRAKAHGIEVLEAKR